MKLIHFLILFMLTMLQANAQKSTYQLFDKSGKTVSYNQMLERMSDADVVLFGELHNNPICHWLQLQAVKDIYYIKEDKLVLGAEMFETDQQLVVNEYLKGLINESHFKSAIKLWTNYSTDYAPLLTFSKENQLEFIATNIPRRYAAIVARKGFDGLNQLEPAAAKYFPPMPIDFQSSLSGYRDMLTMLEGHHGDMIPQNVVKAQAIKDATMAFFINKNYKFGETFLHFNGTYHSNNFEGIYWYLKRLNKQLDIVTIATVEQDEIQVLNSTHSGKADFIICIPVDMTKTH
ncbi:ChaN family lipoprotein [Rapidithrix thailandica]|uniref:ChaN family lipoprotein n=1 Tax=Rapidithrix thailandica TaxID=413964 RepID=A0AAW9SCV9_9BACT